MEERTKEHIKTLIKDLASSVSILTWRIGYETDNENINALTKAKETLTATIKQLKEIIKGE